MTHTYIPSYTLNRNPRLAPNADPDDPTLLDRAIAKAGTDFPSAGAFLYAGLVAAS